MRIEPGEVVITSTCWNCSKRNKKVSWGSWKTIEWTCSCDCSWISHRKTPRAVKAESNPAIGRWM